MKLIYKNYFHYSKCFKFFIFFSINSYEVNSLKSLIKLLINNFFIKIGMQ